MKFVKIALLSLLAHFALANIFYVPDSLSSIQLAIDSCLSGDSIIVTNSFQDSGGISINNKSISIYSNPYLSNPDSYNPASGAALFQEDNSAAIISITQSDSTVIKGFLIDAVDLSTPGGGISIQQSNAVIMEKVFIKNNLFHVENSSLEIRNSKIYDIDTLSSNAITLAAAEVSIYRTLIENNHSASLFQLENASELLMQNTLVQNNNSEHHLFSSSNSTLSIDFTTLTSNESSDSTINCSQSLININRSIIDEDIPLDSLQFKISYSALRQNYIGNGNILEDPALDTTSAYPYLLDTSPCFSATGKDTVSENIPKTDFLGNQRPNPNWSYADMGALESSNYKTANTGHIYWISSMGDDIWGNGTEENPYKSVQTAYDACSENDTLLLTPEVHATAAILNAKNILLSSTYLLYPDQPDLISQTILSNKDTSGSILEIKNADSLSVAGISFSKGSGKILYAGYSYGGAVYLENSYCYFSDLNFLNNTADYAGGAIYAISSTLEADNLSLDSNSAYLGGGIGLSQSSLYLTHSSITASTALAGGGIYANNESQLFAYYCKLSNNSTAEEESFHKYPSGTPLSNTQSGGAIFSSNSYVYFNNGLIANNTAGVAGSAAYLYGGRIKLIQSTVTGNNSDENSNSAISLNNATIGSLVLNSIFWDNDSSDIVLKQQSDIIISHSSLSNANSSVQSDNNSKLIFQSPYYGDPLLSASHIPSAASPFLEKGIASYNFQNYVCINYPDTVYNGIAPDLGYLGAVPAVNFTESSSLDVSHGTLADAFKIMNAYPNPFNPTIRLNFQLAETGNLQIQLYNILGQKIQTLFNQELSSGNYDLPFDLSYLPSAVYICVYRYNGQLINSQKISLVK